MDTDNLLVHLKGNYGFIVICSIESQSRKSSLSSVRSLVKVNDNNLVQMIIKENYIDYIAI